LNIEEDVRLKRTLLLLDAEDAATTRTVVEVAAEIIFIFITVCVCASAEYEDRYREKNFAFFSSMREKDTRCGDFF
jgi:hypothetical protein